MGHTTFCLAQLRFSELTARHAFLLTAEHSVQQGSSGFVQVTLQVRLIAEAPPQKKNKQQNKTQNKQKPTHNE